MSDEQETIWCEHCRDHFAVSHYGPDFLEDHHVPGERADDGTLALDVLRALFASDAYIYVSADDDDVPHFTFDGTAYAVTREHIELLQRLSATRQQQT